MTARTHSIDALVDGPTMEIPTTATFRILEQDWDGLGPATRAAILEQYQTPARVWARSGGPILELRRRSAPA